MLKEKIKSFIAKELAWDKINGDFKDDRLLLDEGIIDSVGMLKLISYIEETFGIKMGEDDLIPDNFETLSSIVGMVEKRLPRELN
jgi:acyl carrier protein